MFLVPSSEFERTFYLQNVRIQRIKLDITNQSNVKTPPLLTVSIRGGMVPLSRLIGCSFISVDVSATLLVDEVDLEVVVALVVVFVVVVVVCVVVVDVVVTVFLVVLVRGSTEQSVIFKLSNANFEPPFV